MLIRAGVLMAFAAAVANAQRGVIDGVVTDSALNPLSSASAWLLGSRLEVVTGENGRFRIRDLPVGEYLIIVRRIGYAPFSTAVNVAAGDTARLSFALVKANVSLDTIRVTAAAPSFSPYLREFENRRKFGQGQYVTADQIHKLNFAGISDYLATLNSITHDGRALNTRFSFPCPYQWFVDGVAIPNPRNIDLELPPPSDIYGIEVYSAAGTIPLQYATFAGGNGRAQPGGSICGVILLWTKR
jgi:hypothetical protein